MRRKFTTIALSTFTAVAMILGIADAPQASSKIENDNAVAGIAVSLNNFYGTDMFSAFDIASVLKKDVGAAKNIEEESSTEETEAKETEGETEAKETQTSENEKKAKTQKTEEAKQQESVYDDLVIAQVESYVNIRTSMDTEVDDNIIGKIPNNCIATVLAEAEAEDGDLWYEISSGNIEKGYVKAEFFVDAEEAKELFEKLVVVKVTIDTERLNVRKEASLEADVIDSVAEGESYKLLDDSDEDFYYVQVSSTVKGYVSKEYSSVTEISYPEAISIEDENNLREELDALQQKFEEGLENYILFRDAADYAGALKEAEYILEISQKLQDLCELYGEDDYANLAEEDLVNAKYAVQIMTVQVNYHDQLVTAATTGLTENLINQITSETNVSEAIVLDALAKAEQSNAVQQTGADQTSMTQAAQTAAEQAAAAQQLAEQQAAAAQAAAQQAAAQQTAAAQQAAAEQAAAAQAAAEQAAAAQAAAEQAAAAAAAQAAAEKAAAEQAAAAAAAQAAQQAGSAVGVSAANYASTWVGVCGYSYGGTNLAPGGGVDCSGFTQQVYAAYGVSLPHSSAAQAGCGVAVGVDQLQPGDLVFYPGPAGGSGVGHVGIYVGNGTIVHAASPTYGICYTNVNFKTILGCRRVA